MPTRRICRLAARSVAFVVSLVLVGLALSGSLAWAIGFELNKTKDELSLKYDVSVTDHGTGRVTVNLAIADQGKMKPLTAVDLVIPSQDGTQTVDLTVSLAIYESDGLQTVRAHLHRDLAERAELQLKTRTIDGKETPLTWYYHTIPLAEYLKK